MSAGSWVRSLRCRSTAAEDVATTVAALPKKPHRLLRRSSCGSSGDIQRSVEYSSCKLKPKSSANPSLEAKKTKAEVTSVRPTTSPPPGPLGLLPALTELPAGHSSRQVVEIIFLSSWSSPLPPTPPTATGGAFTGKVEMLFRVHNQALAVARFEDYRTAVRARACSGAGAARSAADGNEMMRFSLAPPYASPTDATGEDALPLIRTFDGSGGAHASVRGPARSGRRAMVLCRVIAGRVAEGAGNGSSGPGKGHDSVRIGKGELVAFDRRAVLPCFLIIYKL